MVPVRLHWISCRVPTRGESDSGEIVRPQTSHRDAATACAIERWRVWIWKERLLMVRIVSLRLRMHVSCPLLLDSFVKSHVPVCCLNGPRGPIVKQHAMTPPPPVSRGAHALACSSLQWGRPVQPLNNPKRVSSVHQLTCAQSTPGKHPNGLHAPSQVVQPAELV